MTSRVLSVVIVGDSASAQRAFEKTGAAAMAAARTADKASTSFERAGAKMSTLGTNVEKVGKKLTTHLTLPIVAVGGAAVKMSLDFQKAMLLVETHTETSHKQVERYKKAILEMSASGKYTQGPKELADAMYHIASDGYKGEKALHALHESANLAMLGQSELAETTYAVVSAMKTGIKGTQDLHQTIGILNGTMGAGDTKMGELTAALSTGVVPAAKAAGLELTDVGAALAFLTARGIPAQKAAYGLSMNFQQLVPYTEKAANATERLGLGQHELAEVAAKGPEGWLHALQDLERHLQGLGKFERTSAIEELFGGGRTSRGVLAQLQNLKDLEATYERLGVIQGRTDKNLKIAREAEANELAEEKAQLESAFVKLGTTLMPAVIPAIAKIAETVSGVAEDFAKLPHATQDWIIKAGLAVAALGPMLTIGGNILKVFGAVETTIGKIGRGLGVLEAEQMAPAVAGGVAPVGGASRAATAAEASAPGWLGSATVGATTGGTLRGAYNAETEASYLASMGVTKGVSEAEAVRSALGVGKASGLSLAKGFATSLGRGLLTYGGGGLLVGQVVKEVGHSDLASKIGSAIQGAGVGAAIGSAIAPGVGTGIGAAVGGIGAVLLQSIPDEGGKLEEAGAKEARRFLNGFRKEHENGRLQKMVEQGSLGREGRRQGGGAVPGTEYGTTYREGASGLRGQRAELRDKRQSAEFTNQPKAVIKAYSEEISAINRWIAAIKHARESFGASVKGMQGDVALGMGAINKDLATGLSQADVAWGHDTKSWRPHAAEAMQGAVHAIKEGIEDGEINAEKGQKRISELLTKIHLIKGDDPFGLAKATADSFKKAEGPWSTGIKKWERELKLMEPAAAKSAIDSTNKLLQGWAQGHPKIEAQIKSLTNFEISHFGATNKQLREGVKKGATGPVAEAFLEAAQGVSGALGNIGTNTNAMLKALGLHDMVQFQAIVFGPSRMGATTLGAKGAPGEAKHHNAATGWLGGTGLQDTIPIMAAPGEAILNRHQQGPVNAALETVFGYGLDGLFQRIQTPHYMAAGGHVRVSGPSSTGGIGHGALTKALDGINAYFRKHEPHASSAPGGGGGVGGGAFKHGKFTFPLPSGTWGQPISIDQGVDIAAPGGTPLLAIANGTILGHGISGFGPSAPILGLGGGTRVYYGHAGPGHMLSVGTKVKAGQVISEVGSGIVGISSGPHLEIGFYPPGAMGDGTVMAHDIGLPGYAKGGSVGGNKALSLSKQGQAVQSLMRSVWPFAAPFYGHGSSHMPPANFDTQAWGGAFVGDTKVFGPNGGLRKNYLAYPKWFEGWIGKKPNVVKENLVHEWAHYFQRNNIVNNDVFREGGAEAFARWAAPQIYGRAGIRYSNPPFPKSEMYYPWVQRVLKEKGMGWVQKGQFRAKGGRIPGFARGGFTVKGVPASAQQIKTAEEIERAANTTGAPHKARVAAFMAATQESDMGAATSNTFELIGPFEGVTPSSGTYAQAVQWFSKGYYSGPAGGGGGIRLSKVLGDPGAIAQEVEGSAYPGLYEQWKSEGQAWTDGLAGAGGAGGGGGGGKPSKKSAIEHSKFGKGHTSAGGTSAGFAPHKEIEKARAVGAAKAKNPTISHNIGTSRLPSWAAGLPRYQREELEGRGTTLPERETILGNAETNASFEAGVAERALTKAKAAYAKHPDTAHWAAVVKDSSLEQQKRKAQIAAANARKLFEKGYIKHLTVGIKKINHQLATGKGKLTMKQVANLEAKRAELVSLRASARGEAQGATEKQSEYEEAGEAEAAEIEEESPLAKAAQAIGETNWESIMEEAAEAAAGGGQAGEERMAVEKEHTEALKELKKTIDEQNHFAESVSATSAAVATRLLADMLSRHVGANGQLQAQTAGNGSVGTF